MAHGTAIGCVLQVTVYGPERRDFEGDVLAALERAGFAISVEGLRRPEAGRLAISFALVAAASPAVATRQVAEALVAAGVTEAVVGER